MKGLLEDVKHALRVYRRLGPGERDNFGIFTSDTFLNLYKQATSGIFAVLVGVVALSLVVGGIVIMNIMLMVVSERTREIGLRKALGARRADILSQVLTESVTLSIFGGIVGISLGFLAAMTIAAVTPLPARLEPWSVVLGIGINVRPADYPPSLAAHVTSLEHELGRAVDGGLVLSEILVGLSEQVNALENGRGEEVLGRWRALAPSATGRAVSWNDHGVAVRGVTAGVDRQGALLIRAGDDVRRIISGEVIWE